mgnify:CR=1 FL=1
MKFIHNIMKYYEHNLHIFMKFHTMKYNNNNNNNNNNNIFRQDHHCS